MKKIILLLFFFFHKLECSGTHLNKSDVIEMAKKTVNVINKGKQKKDEPYLQSQLNALDKITPAPLAISLLSQIVLFAAQSKIDIKIECPQKGCEFLKYPESFRASLHQVSFAAYDAFNRAHVSMDEISMLASMIPTEVKQTVMTLIQGKDIEIEHLLPLHLESIKGITKDARAKANETVWYFDRVKNILQELIMGGTTTKKTNSDKIKKKLEKETEEMKYKADDLEKKINAAIDQLSRIVNTPGNIAIKIFTIGIGGRNIKSEREAQKAKIAEIRKELRKATDRYDKYANMLKNTSSNVYTAIRQLHKFDASKAGIDEIIRILEEAMVTLVQVQKRWYEILEFFQKIESLIDVKMGKALDKFRNKIDKARKIQKKTGGVAKFLRKQIYKDIQETMSSGHLVNRMSTIYINISTEFIMPPLRDLGNMMEMNDTKQIEKAKDKIMNQTDNAAVVINARIKKEKEGFDAKMQKKMQEIESTFGPSLELNIPVEQLKNMKDNEMNQTTITNSVKSKNKMTSDAQSIKKIKADNDDENQEFEVDWPMIGSPFDDEMDSDYSGIMDL